MSSCSWCECESGYNFKACCEAVVFVGIGVGMISEPVVSENWCECGSGEAAVGVNVDVVRV